MKQATTITEQIEILVLRGMIIRDKDKAREILLDIGYYRLGFYWFPFEKTYPKKDSHRLHDFAEGTYFDDAVDLYYFDHDLRQIILSYLCRIEINLRTFVIYKISNKYKQNPQWFTDISVLDIKFINHFIKSYNDNIKNNIAIKQHHRKYPGDVYAPAWKTLEYATFGDMIMLCNSLKDSDLQYEIAEHYGIRRLDVFFSYIGTMRVLRNLCAHEHNIYDMNLQKSIKKGVLKTMTSNECHNLAGALYVMMYLLDNISSNRVRDFKNELLSLLKNNRTKRIYSIISYLEQAAD